MKDEFRFRLNGIYLPEIRIERAMIAGQPVGSLQIAGRVEEIGWVTIDGNENLWDKDLPRFVLEYRNETEWGRTDPLLRRISKDKGWRTVTPQNLLRVLQTAGCINVDECRGE